MAVRPSRTRRCGNKYDLVKKYCLTTWNDQASAKGEGEKNSHFNLIIKLFYRFFYFALALILGTCSLLVSKVSSLGHLFESYRHYKNLVTHTCGILYVKCKFELTLFAHPIIYTIRTQLNEEVQKV